MYDLSSSWIAAALLAGMGLALAIGTRLGLRRSAQATEAQRSHLGAILAAILGILALLLGFTFSLALQRHDSRSETLLAEANALETTAMRAQLLPDRVRAETLRELRAYADLRVQAAVLSLDRHATRQDLARRTRGQQERLWTLARAAVEIDARNSTSGHYVVALNEMFDAYGRHQSALSRHVPEVVMALLYATFTLSGLVLGYASGTAGHRVSPMAWVLVLIVVLLVFLIIDLDRPRRGFIQVDPRSLIEAQASMVEPAASLPAR